MNLHRATVLSVTLLALAATTDDLSAQGARVPGQLPGELPGPGWAPPSLGVRFGWDNQQQDEVLGGHVRLPILPSGTLELMGSMDVTFLVALKEYQYNIEGVYVLDGRAGGLYGGVGLGLRNTIYPNEVSRTTELGYTLVVGFRLVGLGLIVPQAEYRRISITKAPIAYQQLTLGLSLALWRPVAPR